MTDVFITLDCGTQFKIGNTEFEIKSIVDDKTFEVFNKNYRMTERITLKELHESFYTDDETKKLRFYVESDSDETAKWDMENHTPLEKQDMDRKYAIIQPIIEGRVQNVTEYVDNYPTALLPSSQTKLYRSTVYRWIKKYSRQENKLSLLPAAMGPKGRHINTETMGFLRDFIEELDKKAEIRTTRDKWLLYEKEVKSHNIFREEKQQLSIFSESTFRRLYKEMHDPRPRQIQIMGIAHADLAQNGVRSSFIAERPLQYVELDWTPLDYIIVNFDTDETYRPIVMYAVDKYTDMPLGYIVIFKEQPSAGDWKQLLLQIMTPKTHIQELYPRVQKEWSGYGKPQTIIMDNASVNDCEEVSEVCGAIGIGLLFNEKASGHQKGTVENALGKINRVFHAYRGTTFSNFQEKGHYNSKKKACVDINKLHEMIHIVIVDLVANKYNRGVGGIPEDLWNEALKDSKIRRQLPQQKEYIELLFASNSTYRTIGPKGIELQGQFFNSDPLNELRLMIQNTGGNKKVRVRYGMDMRHIYVYDEKNKRYVLAYLKLNSRLMRHHVDFNYPIHEEHLAQLCYVNNRDANEFLQNQEHVTDALTTLEAIVQEGSQEYKQTKRKRRREDVEKSKGFSAVYGVGNKADSIPHDANVILVNQEEADGMAEHPSNVLAQIPEDSSAAKIIEEEALDKVDFEQINASWTIERKLR